MTLPIKTYYAKPTEVEAIQITEENMKAVAKWCGGRILEKEIETRDGVKETAKFIKARVGRVVNERQSQGFVGDWVILRGTHFKIFTEKAFQNSYMDDPESIPLTALQGHDIPGDLIYQSMIDEAERAKKATKVKVEMGPHTASIDTGAIKVLPSDSPAE